MTKEIWLMTRVLWFAEPWGNTYMLLPVQVNHSQQSSSSWLTPVVLAASQEFSNDEGKKNHLT